ncbi:MAG: carbon starvation protein A [Lachnospiraceae bacterium]|uniref:Carbon starvation protein A n=1 Tax=Candidatus Weimeria bifida TaxID=2599074 RepID=A0A6N7IZU3_9FIRM|nr:carbon starvation protein A [Candidatus Weimeria bifida]RRF95451.1 MAG: carbon starvation protein A [Lachnospiraceae bacterium]
MATFIIGLVILIGGGALYGHFCERVFEPDDRETPAYAKQDGVDYVPMATWRNALINLLNIAGTGPILGPIQGILFGPVAFLAIPIGNVIGGSMHDYFAGMICTREGGMQMPQFVEKYTNRGIYYLYDVFICILLLLVGAVFIYTPGDIFNTQILGRSGAPSDPVTWVIYTVIFVYYLIATVFPIDKIIGRIYPIFGAILLISAVGIFVAIFAKGYPLTDIWASWNTVGANGANSGFNYGAYFGAGPFADGAKGIGGHFLPIFFVTVACGILSGFHTTQTALVSRTIKSERKGRFVFYDMMVTEGFIAMCWAAGTMAMINLGAKAGGVTMLFDQTTKAWTFNALVNGKMAAVSATSVVGILCKNALGPVGGMISIIGVIVLPITSGDTALRSLRLTLTDTFHLKQEKNSQRLLLAAPIFALVYVILVWAKLDANGFNILWRYFAWSNQMISLFALAGITIYMFENNKARFAWMPMIAGTFYSFVTCAFIAHAQIGLNLPWVAAYTVALVWTVFYDGITIHGGVKRAKAISSSGADTVAA